MCRVCLASHSSRRSKTFIRPGLETWSIEKKLEKVWKALGCGGLEYPWPRPCVRPVPSGSSCWHNLLYEAFPRGPNAHRSTVAKTGRRDEAPALTRARLAPSSTAVGTSALPNRQQGTHVAQSLGPALSVPLPG